MIESCILTNESIMDLGFPSRVRGCIGPSQPNWPLSRKNTLPEYPVRNRINSDI